MKKNTKKYQKLVIYKNSLKKSLRTLSVGCSADKKIKNKKFGIKEWSKINCNM
jgi:hypothetical protein